MNRLDSKVRDAVGVWLGRWFDLTSTFASGNSEVFGRHAAWLHRRLSECQSPIEQLFLLALLNGPAEPTFCEATFATITNGRAQLELEIQQQRRVERDGHAIAIIDFAINDAGKWDPEHGFGPPRFMLAVELDGHDFHERTKEQAQRDKARDRALAAAGYRVLRFTGSEVWRDAGNCVDELLKVALSICEETAGR